MLFSIVAQVALSTLTGNDRTRLASSQKVRVMPLLIATSYPPPSIQ